MEKVPQQLIDAATSAIIFNFGSQRGASTPFNKRGRDVATAKRSTSYRGGGIRRNRGGNRGVNRAPNRGGHRGGANERNTDARSGVPKVRDLKFQILKLKKKLDKMETKQQANDEAEQKKLENDTEMDTEDEKKTQPHDDKNHHSEKPSHTEQPRSEESQRKNE